MKIRVFKSNKLEFGPIWASHIEVFLFDFYYFGIQISFSNHSLGKKPFDAIEYRKFLNEKFNQNCLVCGNPLLVTDVKQDIKYHAACRKLRHKVHAKLV